MDAIIHSFQGIFTIILMIGTGFVLARRGWFSESFTTAVARLVMNICLPSYMIVSLSTNFTYEELLSMSGGLLVPMISMVMGYFIGHLFAKILKVRKERVGVFCAVFFVSNVVFIGLPMTLALFGEAGIPYLMIYYMVNTIMFWIVAAHDMASDAGHAIPWFSKKTLKVILSPPLVGFMIGVIFIFLGWRLPLPVESAFRYIGNMTTPLGMLFIGIVMSKASWADIRFDKELVGAMFGRFIICPLCVLVCLPFFSIPTLMADVFVMQAAMPAMTNTSIVAKIYGADYKYAATLTVVSTLIALAAIPFYMWVIRG